MLVSDNLQLHRFLSCHFDYAWNAHQSGQDEGDPEAGSDNHYGGPPHLADIIGRGMDQGGVGVERHDSQRLRQEEQRERCISYAIGGPRHHFGYGDKRSVAATPTNR